MNRRNFLTHSGIMLASASQLGWMARTANADAQQDYCALVCILLAGGADSFNMLVPSDIDRYDQYAAARSDLALGRSDLLPLAYSGAQGQTFGVHPGMPEVQSLFDSGDLAFVANVGPLAEPTSRAALEAGSVDLPLGLFSHSDQIAVWQTSAAGTRTTTGVAGRMADILNSQVNSGPISMNISLAGSSLFQTGEMVTGYAVDAAEGVRELAGYNDDDSNFDEIVDRLLAVPQTDAFRSTYAAGLRRSIDAGQALNASLATAPSLTTTFADTPFSQALAQIARLISARASIGASRQTFFITVGGWDHHDEVLNNQANMLPGISQGLGQFHAALTELGLLDAVTTFTISDFGRTLTSNGRGSDHGWGGNQMVMGGAVDGGTIFGAYPELALGGELDLGRGRFLPTTSTDEVYADLALWFGIAPGELGLVLPNIARFTDVSGGTPPLGLFV
ncbi:MAG: DUF1501 domain-containing protein [Pseudomonadota bacterium]